MDGLGIDRSIYCIGIFLELLLEPCTNPGLEPFGTQFNSVFHIVSWLFTEQAWFSKRNQKNFGLPKPGLVQWTAKG